MDSASTGRSTVQSDVQCFLVQRHIISVESQNKEMYVTPGSGLLATRWDQCSPVYLPRIPTHCPCSGTASPSTCMLSSPFSRHESSFSRPSDGHHLQQVLKLNTWRPSPTIPSPVTVTVLSFNLLADPQLFLLKTPHMHT